MPKTTIRGWLMDHPHVLNLAFLFVLLLAEYPDLTTQSGGSVYTGP